MLEVVDTTDLFCHIPCFFECRQQHRHEDGDDCNHHEQFDQGEFDRMCPRLRLNRNAVQNYAGRSQKREPIGKGKLAVMIISRFQLIPCFFLGSSQYPLFLNCYLKILFF